MSDTYSYEVLEPGGHARLVGNVFDRISEASANPASAVGSASALLGDAETASWMERTTAADGAALIDAIYGNTLRWNQLVGNSDTSVTVPSGHKYVSRIDGTAVLATSDGTAISVTGGTDCIFDLTAMFGAGNEPSTVAEFTALYPEQYYPYDSGSLLPVRMEGIETVGFNQWNEEWEIGTLSTVDGSKSDSTANIRTKNFNPCLSNTAYCVKLDKTYTTGVSSIFFYDADKHYLTYSTLTAFTTVVTTPANAHYFMFALTGQYGTTYKNDICINLSDPARNGEYEPHWSSQRTIPAATYFPGGLRSAGSVYDELQNDKRITRVGAVDLGTLTWHYNTDWNGGPAFYATLAGSEQTQSQNVANMRCAKYETVSRDYLYNNPNYMGTGLNGNTLSIRDSAYTDVATFKAAMSGVMLHYALATPTTQPIDPPLPMSYRTGAGGTERVMVASGTTSAPPVFATRYPLDPTDLAASIAPVDGPTAKTNHQVGDLLMLGFTLCKATQVIVTGETIEIGTNVTKTTVAAEIAALS